MKNSLLWLALAVSALACSFVFFSSAHAAPTVCQIGNGCTGTSTAPAYGKILIGGLSGEYEYVASSTLLSGAVSSVFGRTGAVAAQSGDYTTSLVPEGSNVYWTQARFDTALTGTTSLPKITTLGSLALPYSQLTSTPDLTQYLTLSAWYGTTTDQLKEGSNNLYFTNARVASYISGSSTVPHIGGSAYGNLLLWNGSGWVTTATSSLGLKTSSFASANVSQWTNDAGYLTSLSGAASSTLLSDNNTFSGVDKFTNASSDFSGTWQTFSPSHFQTALGFTAVPNTRAINTTYPLQGGGDLSADRTLTFPATSTLYAGTAGQILALLNGQWIGTATSTYSSPLSFNAGTNAVSIQAAGASQNGYESSSDYQLLHTATTTYAYPLTYTVGTNAVTFPATSTQYGSGTAGQVLMWSGTTGAPTWAATSSSGLGSVTSIAFGDALNGGTITTSGNVNLKSYFSTSTADTAGQLAYANSTNGWPVKLSFVATSTLSASSPLTGSFTQIGSGGSVGCQTASASQAGCLSASDWNKFNNQLSTTSPWTTGQVAFVNSNGNVSSVATGTVSAGSTAITVTAGRSVLGGALAIDCAAAGASQNGCLSSGDWSTFNGKLNLSNLWNVATTYSTTTLATTTPLWFKTGYYASSTASTPSIDDYFIAQQSTTTNATTTTLGFVNLKNSILATNGSGGVVGSSTIGSNLLSNSGVSANSYTCTNLTVTAQGILTSASNGSCGGGGGTWPFTTTDTNFAATPQQSTTTPEWFKGNGTWGLFASSTSMFDSATTTNLGVISNAYFPGNSIWNSNGRVGIGTTNITGFDANARLTVANTGFISIDASSTDITTSSAGELAAISDQSELAMLSHGSLRTNVRYGITLGGWTEFSDFNTPTSTSNGFVIGVQASSPLVFGTNNVERMRVTGAGNIGIATTTPDAITSIFHTGNTNIGLSIEHSSAQKNLNGDDPELMLTNFNTTVGNYSAIDFTDNTVDTNAVRLLGIYQAHGASPSGDFAILTANAGTVTEKMRVMSWGAIVMGTTTSQLGGLTIGTSTAPQLILSDNTAADNAWTFRSINNNLYIATSSASATSSTAAIVITNATTTLSQDVQISGLNGSQPNPYLLIGTTSPGYGRLAGGLVDAVYYNASNISAINAFNGSSGACAGSGFFADGNILALNSDYAFFGFTNAGWTGSGCAVGNAKERPESTIISNPTGDMNFELASTSQAVAYKWWTQNTTQSMTLNNWGALTVGTTTTQSGQVTIGTSSAPQLMLSDNTAADNLWSLRTIANTLYFATSTATATSTPLLTFSSNFGIGIASTTPQPSGLTIGWGNLVLGAGQFAMAYASSTNPAQIQTIDWNSGGMQRIIASSSLSLVINATSSHPYDGGHYILKICQDGTGSRSITFITPGQLAWANGTTTISSAANSGTLLGMIYDARIARYDVVASSTISDVRTCVP